VTAIAGSCQATTTSRKNYHLAVQSLERSAKSPNPIVDRNSKDLLKVTSKRTAIMAQTDLDDPHGEYAFLDKLVRRLDRHLSFPVLDFVAQAEDIPEARFEDLQMAKFNLLKNSKMMDFLETLYKDTYNTDSVPPEYAQRKDQNTEQLQQYEKDTEHILAILSNDDITSQLRSDKVANLKFLEESHGVTAPMLESLYAYGRFQYDVGSYQDAADLLYRFRILSTDNDKVAKATWGKLVCENLSANWDESMEEIERLKEHIETRLFNNPRAQLTSRESLVHYALFPFFKHEPAREKLTELYFSPPYISTIQTVCPWILRYLTAAVITNRARTINSYNYQKQLKDLVRVVKQEMYEYEDPVTGFIKALYVDFDFEGAQNKLLEAEALLRGDFFLSSSADAFVEASRHLITESYCKIHQRIDIKYVPLPSLLMLHC
jgi:translation initiation factor 3 subunit E